MPRARISAVLANEGWARRSKGGNLGPHLTWMLDILNLSSHDLTLFGEAHVDRKLSLGGLIGRESFADELRRDIRASQIDEIGGYLRYYVMGHAGTGIHLGLEAVRGFADIRSIFNTPSLASYGLTFGYRYTFDCGFTVELASSQRWLVLADPMAPQRRIWERKPLSHINFGWSF
jgi:hypothetical protein